MKYKVLTILIFILSCNKKKDNSNQKLNLDYKDTTYNRTKNESKRLDKENIIKIDSITDKDKLINMYESSNSSDTLIPLEVYKIVKSELFYDSLYKYDAIKTYDQNKNEYQNYIRKMFYFDKNIDEVFEKAEKHIEKTRNLAKEAVLNDYKEFASVEGENFSYLCNVKDSFALTISKKMFQNNQSNKVELKRIANSILENFNDSIYLKKLNEN